MGKNFMDAETNGNVVKDAMIKLGKGMSFIMKFDNDEFESMFLDECIFYHKELDVSNEDGIYRVSVHPEANKIVSAKTWNIMFQKYRALSNWGADAPVEFLGAFNNDIPISGIAMFPVAFLQA